jgi:hypothetical protein
MVELKRQKTPVGMIIILVIMGWSILSIFLTFRNPISQFGPILLRGFGAIIYCLIVAAILSAIFYGILKQMAWARKMAIGWYIFSMVMGLVNLLSFMANNTMYNEYYNKTLTSAAAAIITPAIITVTLVMTLILSWIMGIVFVIYFVKKKDYFVN